MMPKKRPTKKRTDRYRPKLTDEARGQVLAALRVGADAGMASRAVGVSRTALYKLMDRDSTFKEEVDEARNFADEVIVKRLYEKAKDGDVKAITFWLKNRKRHEWRDRHEHQVDHRGVIDLVQRLHEGRRRAGKD